MKRKYLAIGVGLGLLATACGEEDPGGMMGTDGTPRPLLGSYVAVGNSLTAGFQSGGISDSVQMDAYPVLVAQQMGLSIGTDFIVPSLAGDGCAPPITNIFTQERVNGGASTDCFGRVDQSQVPHNLGIPGAHMQDAVTITQPTNPYFGLFLNGDPPMTVAATLDPTFMSLWMGSNDILGAATQGDLADLTSLDDFEDHLNQVLAAMDAMNLEGAILIGIPHVTSAPYFSPAAAYWVAEQMGSLPPSMDVLDNCATTAAGGIGEATLVGFPKGFGLIAAAQAGANVTLDCGTDMELLHLPEIAALIGSSARFNTMISRAASERGWAYWDPNPTLDSVRAAGGATLFPNTQGADALFIPFGDFLSRDGIHPSTMAHRVIANHVINAINATYSAGIPNLN